LSNNSHNSFQKIKRNENLAASFFIFFLEKAQKLFLFEIILLVILSFV